MFGKVHPCNIKAVNHGFKIEHPVPTTDGTGVPVACFMGYNLSLFVVH